MRDQYQQARTEDMERLAHDAAVDWAEAQQAQQGLYQQQQAPQQQAAHKITLVAVALAAAHQARALAFADVDVGQDLHATHVQRVARQHAQQIGGCATGSDATGGAAQGQIAGRGSSSSSTKTERTRPQLRRAR